jgi:putative solute:sodium symporter small subunit
MNKNLADEYWKKNLKYLLILLSIWFTVSFGFGILLIDELNQIKIGGFKLGFWFAQQGSIYVFVTLIFIYIGLMNKLDKKYHSKNNYGLTNLDMVNDWNNLFIIYRNSYLV